ncbi:MAG: polyamine ABC transporter ATP-binding protein, partial [Youngiibacter sp.]|nr:polyamine ABC transporter ATP-binding protein [Youngiibacter sp.]
CVPGMKVTISVRPEEFSIDSVGLTVRIKGRTFLGKYTNYELDFPESMILPNQPSIEYSQDIGMASGISSVGDMLTLKPNPKKINVFTEDGKRSLMKEASDD